MLSARRPSAHAFFQIAHVENDTVIRSHSAIEASNLSFVVHGGAKLTMKARNAITFDRSEVCWEKGRLMWVYTGGGLDFAHGFPFGVSLGVLAISGNAYQV